MQIRKTYLGVNPELLHDEVKDFVQKQGAILSEAKFETYSLPTDSSTFVARGTLIFKAKGKTNATDKECLRAHIMGTASSEVKLMLDIDEELFPKEKVSAVEDDLNFIFSQCEKKSK